MHAPSSKIQSNHEISDQTRKVMLLTEFEHRYQKITIYFCITNIVHNLIFLTEKVRPNMYI